MNSIWNKNISLFKNRFESLFQMYEQSIKAAEASFSQADIANQPFIENIQLLSAKNGEITGRENNVALHSGYAPSREAEKAISTQEMEQKSAAVFYGTGLGYHVIEFCKKYSEKKLVIIEPEILRFFQTLSVLDWEVVFKHENLVLAIGCPQQFVLGLIENQSKINIGNTGVNDACFFDLPAFTNHAKQYFEDVKTIIQRNIRKNQINEATLKKFGKLWCHNSLKNLNKLSECNFINVFHNKAQQLPFLIIGAGPSLESILPYLKELKKRMIVVCVETALHILLRHNIEPDFILLMDSQFWAYKHIAGLKASSSILITEISVYPSVFRFDCKKIMLSASQFPVGKYIEEKCGFDCGDLGTGGSVASACWNFAYYCGSRNIYFAGLDLSYPLKQTHIKGSSAEQAFHTFSNRKKTAENFTAGTIFSADCQKSENYKGEKVSTDSRMKMFAWWFEARLANCPDAKTYTLCAQSMKIPGVEFCSVENSLLLPEIQNIKNDFIDLSSKENKTVSETFLKITRDFPDNNFFEEYPFLKDYL